MLLSSILPTAMLSIAAAIIWTDGYAKNAALVWTLLFMAVAYGLGLIGVHLLSDERLFCRRCGCRVPAKLQN